LLHNSFLRDARFYPYISLLTCNVPGGRYNMEVDCSDDAYKNLQTVAVLFFGIYPIGVFSPHFNTQHQKLQIENKSKCTIMNA